MFCVGQDVEVVVPDVVVLVLLAVVVPVVVSVVVPVPLANKLLDVVLTTPPNPSARYAAASALAWSLDRWARSCR
jgi:hypothetical protein